MSPLDAILETHGGVVLDGGLATELEALGCDLGGPLWSAGVLLEHPDLIRRACRRFLDAGADCVATATYQASVPGLVDRGLAPAEIAALLNRAVDMVVEERDAFWADLRVDTPDRVDRSRRARPIVAASIGPYGASLADGSEYRGDYGLSAADLYDFHAERWAILADSAADILACETTPSLEETLAYCRLAAVSARPTWISFQCRDEKSIADGTPLETAISAAHTEPHVVAVGINCTAPDLITPLIEIARRSTDRPILVYPNSGETWDAATRSWVGRPTPTDWAARAVEWRGAGAAGIGGCCRVRPADITSIRTALAAG